MHLKQLKKLFITSFITIALAFCLSICAQAEAQIESLSKTGDVIYATLSGEDASNATLYAVTYNEGVLVDAFFSQSDEDGIVTLNVSQASQYSLYLWDKTTLAPLSAPYLLIEDIAYSDGGKTPIPPYNANSYSFNQDSNVMIVSSLSSNSITGFVSGVETTYPISGTPVVLGLSDKLSDVSAGSVVMLGTNSNGQCMAIELLATMGMPVDPTVFDADFGVYSPSDNSVKYKNVVSRMFSKSGTKITVRNYPDTTKVKYKFASTSVPCYRVGIAIDNGIPVVSCKTGTAASGSDIFASTVEYHNYVYFRVNTELTDADTTVDLEQGRIVECVVYCVPTNFDPGKGDDEYTDIFGLGKQIIIE